VLDGNARKSRARLPVAARLIRTDNGYLIEIGNECYVRHKRDRTLKRGDRVAVPGRRTAVIEHANSRWIQAVVLNKYTLRIACTHIR
jgi:hypothetical protein